MKKFFTFLSICLCMTALPSLAAMPVDWGLGLQESASPVRDNIDTFHTMMMYIITAITLFVLGLLIYVVLRFNKRANPKPADFSHNTLIEVIWTAIPVIILVVIAIPSFNLLFYADRTPEPEMSIKAIGFQWAWEYEYPDHDGITFKSYMIPDDEIKEGQVRLLETDNAVVLPIDTNIQVLVTASDVLHSFAVPALGLKTDAVPGRFNETWVRINKPGIYYGQCSEICGTGHAYMPIMIKAVTKEEFDNWVIEAKEKFAHNDNQIDLSNTTQIAIAE